MMESGVGKARACGDERARNLCLLTWRLPYMPIIMRHLHLDNFMLRVGRRSKMGIAELKRETGMGAP